MAHAHSYGATLTNNRSENEAALFLFAEDSRFKVPTRIERKHILSLLDLAPSFSRAFDMAYLPSAESDVMALHPEELVLVELKTTKKKLPNIPRSFFFGATENEFNLAKKLGDKYRFCFVSLHPESRGFALLTLDELEKIIKTKRIQYQINL